MDAMLKQLYEDLAIRGVSMVRIDPVEQPPKREKLNITAIWDKPRFDPNIHSSLEKTLEHITSEWKRLFGQGGG